VSLIGFGRSVVGEITLPQLPASPFRNGAPGATVAFRLRPQSGASVSFVVAGRSEGVRPFATFLALRTVGCSRAIDEMDSLSGTKWVGVSRIGRRILINHFDDPNERGSGFEA